MVKTLERGNGEADAEPGYSFQILIKVTWNRFLFYTKFMKQLLIVFTVKYLNINIRV